MSQVDDCVGIINQTIASFKPEVGLILGSGLGQFCDNINTIASLDFDSLPGFPVAGVGGHAGRLLFGKVEDTNVVVMQGRAHYYENGRADIMAVAIQTLNAIGCKSLVLTNAAGSLVKEASPGSVMLITDHINMTGVSPLFGAESNKRFVDMSDAYNPELNANMRSSAKMNDITLHEGVYAWFSGPQFETPAEIKAVKTLGVDAVGMSTVPEVIVANQLEMDCIAFSVLTDVCDPDNLKPIDISDIMTMAKKAEQSLIVFVKKIISSL